MRFTTHEKNLATLFVARQVRTSVVKHATSLINSFCSNVAKQVARLTVAQKKTKTKQFCTLFLYIFLPLFCTTTTWNFLVKRIVEELSFSPWWPLAFLSFLPLLHNNFHAFLPTKVVSFVFYLSLYPFLCYPRPLWQLSIHLYMDAVYNWQAIVIFHVHGLLPCLSIVLVNMTFEIALHVGGGRKYGRTEGHVITKISCIHRDSWCSLPVLRARKSFAIK